MIRKPELRWVWGVLIFVVVLGVAFFDWGTTEDDRLGRLVQSLGRYPTAALLVLGAVLCVRWDWGWGAHATDRDGNPVDPSTAALRRYFRVLGFLFLGLFVLATLLSLARYFGSQLDSDREFYRNVAIAFACSAAVLGFALRRIYRKKCGMK